MNPKHSEEKVGVEVLTRGERLGFALLFAAAVGFGIAPSCAKIAYGSGAEPQTLVAARFALCLFGIAAIVRIRHIPLVVGGKLLMGSLVMGCLLVWNASAYLSAVQHIPVSVAAALFYTFPVQVGVIATIFGVDSLTVKRLLALIVAFGGVLFLVGFGETSATWYGVVLALGAGSGVAISSVLFDRIAHPGNSMAVLFWAILVGSLVSCMVVGFRAELQLPHDGFGWLGFVVSMFGFSFALITYYLALPLVGAVRGALMANLEPVIAIAVAVIILDEQLGVFQVLGVTLILASIFLAKRGAPRAVS